MAINQEIFTDIEYSFRKKKTKLEKFLEIMDEIIPWDEWVGVIEPYYPKGKRGHPTMGLRKCCGCICFRSGSTCLIQQQRTPFMTALLCENSRALTSRQKSNNLNKLFFNAINRVIVQTGHIMKGGTIVDATIINAPSSTKNAEKSRDPEMHQTIEENE